jgi:TPP-dependent pyruvate/acetoin dehydrogenase alpha subunit
MRENIKYDKQFLIGLYKTMYTIRHFEQRCIQLYRQGHIRGYFHPYLGEEAIATGVCAALREDDYIASTHRGHGHCIAKGVDLKKMIAELFGKEDGYCRGLGGSMHIADPAKYNLGANAIVGANVPHAVGAALSIKMQKSNQVSVAFSSDGAANNGVFFEALNLAGAWSLPFILVIENNQYAVSTPIEQSTREVDLYKRGTALGIESEGIDGNDVLTVYEHTKKAVAKCRKGKGPFLIEAKTYRHGGHHVNDPGQYLPKDKLDYYLSIDPLTIGKKYCLQEGNIKEDELKELENTVKAQMEEAVNFAQQSPEMPVEDLRQMVEGW